MSDRTVDSDVLVIGGGLGGLVSAIRASELGVRVAIVDKGTVGKSGASAFATAGYLAVFDSSRGLDPQRWVDWATTLGEFINDRDWLDIQIRESLANFQALRSWGVPCYEEKGIPIQVCVSPGANNVKLRRREFTRALREKAQRSGVTVFDGVAVTDLLKQEGRAVGAVGIDTRGEGLVVFFAKSTVIAAGGGSFKAPNSVRDYRTADGEAMAYRAGAEITGKEFHNKIGGGVRRYPNGSCDSGAGPYSSRTYLNALGEEFAFRYGSGERARAYLRFASAMFFEAHAGRAPIYWDLDAVSAEDRKRTVAYQEAENLKMLPDRCGLDVLAGGKIDFFEGGSAGDSGQGCGGIRLLNTKCETSLPGLYAVGDAAGTYLSGCSYNGVGHGLSNAALTGYHAGEAAAAWAQTVRAVPVDRAQIARLEENAVSPLKRVGGFTAGWLTQMIQNTMVPYYVLQVKHADRLRAALTMIEFLRSHCAPMMRAEDYHGLRMTNEVRNMLLNAEMLLRASLFRTESRGSHYREDYPRRDDPDWLAWTVLKEDQGEMKLSKAPLPREWWPDLSLPYQRRYDWRFPAELEGGLAPYPWPEQNVANG